MGGVLLTISDTQSLQGSKQVDAQTLESKPMVDAATSLCYDARGLIEYVVKEPDPANTTVVLLSCCRNLSCCLFPLVRLSRLLSRSCLFFSVLLRCDSRR